MIDRRSAIAAPRSGCFPFITKNHQSTRKWSAGFGAAEFQASFEIDDFPMHGVGMPPTGVGPGGDQADHCCSRLRRFISLSHPVPDLASVGWVHKNNLAGPILDQAVLGTGEVPPTFCILVRRARIKGEAKLPVEAFKEIRGRCPFIRPRGKVNFISPGDRRARR